MTIQIQVANDTVASVRLVKGKPVADIDALRKYHRDYYHANKENRECEHCTCKFTSQSALVRHQRRNLKCALLRAKAELDMLRSGQKVQISEATSVVAETAVAEQEEAKAQEIAAIKARLAELEEEEESKCDRCGSQDGVIGGGANDYFINLCKRCFDKDAAAAVVAEQEEDEDSKCKCDRCGSQDGVIGGGANDYFINLCNLLVSTRRRQEVQISEATSVVAETAVAEQEEEEESKCDRCGSQDGVIGCGANDYFINLCKRCRKLHDCLRQGCGRK